MPDYVLQALFVVTGLLLLRQVWGLLRGTKNPLGRAGLHAVMGLAGLLTANGVGAAFGLGLGLNGLTVPVSAALGVPGVGLLWAVQYLL